MVNNQEKNMNKPPTLNPGSPEAIESGCLCPVIDNHHGKGVPCGKDGAPMFWESAKCPLHGDPRFIDEARANGDEGK